MKTIFYIVIFSISILISDKLMADEIFTKKVEKSYNLKNNSYFKIYNKFGKIHIENNENNSLEIIVTFSVKAKNQEKANKFFSSVNVNFSSIDTMIQAITEFSESSNFKDFSIDYNIKMPDWLRIDLENLYGDVYISKLTSLSNLKVKYGNFKANNLIFGDKKPRTILDLSYSNGVIETTDWLKLLLSYSEIEITQSKGLIIKSKYSQVSLKRSESVVADSKYDQPYEIQSVKNFAVSGAYSRFEIEELTNLLDADLKYSDIEINKVLPNFSEIKLIVKYGNGELRFDKNGSYFINAESEYGTIEYPENESINELKDKSESKVSGRHGSNKNTKSKVKIDVKYGNVDIINE